jgi:hypothetical protein
MADWKKFKIIGGKSTERNSLIFAKIQNGGCIQDGEFEFFQFFSSIKLLWI